MRTVSSKDLALTEETAPECDLLKMKADRESKRESSNGEWNTRKTKTTING